MKEFFKELFEVPLRLPFKEPLKVPRGPLTWHRTRLSQAKTNLQSVSERDRPLWSQRG